jgi:hypothetical protein
MEGLCAGIAYAHRMSVVHRDIKPANLMIDRSGRLRILDFGIARMIGTASNTSMLLGTPGYTAPEQIKGEPVDHRADIFAAGVVMYELIALREAFPGEAAATIMHRVLNEEPTPLSEVIPDLRPEIAAICARALKKQPGERFESAEKMREAVSRVRVELEVEAGLTIIPGAVQRDVPPAPDVERPPAEARPATGSTPSRRPTGPRRTDRESLARRRADLLATEVQIGRERLQRGDIEGARESYLRALTVDEGHEEVLALERDVEIAAAAAETAAAPDDSEMTTIATAAALPGATGDAAGVAAMPARPTSDERTVLIRPTPAGVAVALPSSLGNEPETSGTPKTSGAPETHPARANQPAGAPARPRRRMLVAGVALAVLAIALAGMSVWRGASVPPSGTLVIEAVPWAMVTSIENEAGDAFAVEGEGSTPLTLSLPAGRYRIVLTGPPPESRRTDVQTTVTANAIVLSPPATFQTITPEQYFEAYLEAALPSVDATARDGDGGQP